MDNLCHNTGWGDLRFDVEIDPLVRDLRRRYGYLQEIRTLFFVRHT